MAGPTYFTYQTPVGRITIGSDGNSLTRIAFGVCTLDGQQQASTLTNNAANQLQQYFAGKRFVFDLPLCAQGSDFQRAVWEAVSAIPYGQTRSYQQIAAEVGNPKATRAVGMASNRNPLPIVVPCHRVIGANGKPTGYAGGLKVKEFLLELERSHTPR